MLGTFITNLTSFVFLSVGQATCLPAENFSNYLDGTYWHSDRMPFESPEQGSYTFTPAEEMGDMLHWGNFISFTDTTFSTHYSAPCGNDCFTSVTGTYRYVAQNTINVHVSKIHYSGFCGERENSAPFSARYMLEFSGNNLLVAKRPKQD